MLAANLHTARWARSCRPGRNEPCHCGSHRKYKRCCQERDERAAQQERGIELPAWIIDSRRKLHQFEKYATDVYGLPRLLGSFRDGRRAPTYPTIAVVGALFHAALLRRPSINAAEGDLKQADFQKLIGSKPQPGVKVFSAEVISNVLDQLELIRLRNTSTAFNGDFDILTTDTNRLVLRWQNGETSAVLDADLATELFTITHVEDGLDTILNYS